MKYFIASTAWSFINLIHRSLYDLGVLRPKRLGCRTVSVGNIQAGGSGKTPVVAWVAHQAIARQERVCILTRGYKGATQNKGAVIEPFQKQVEATEVGDEPALLHQRVPEAWIGIGANRFRSFKTITQRMGRLPDLVILDDGFQKLSIARDLDIVLLTARSRFSYYFREFGFVSLRAQLRVWTKGFERPMQCNARVQFEIAPNLIPETRFFLFTTVADPDDLKKSLKLRGYTVEEEWILNDHEFPQLVELKEKVDFARGRKLKWIMTQKDRVKLPADFESKTGDCAVLEPDVKILEGQDLFQRYLGQRYLGQAT